MRNKLFPLLAVILTLWLFGGAYWLSSMHSEESLQNKLPGRLFIEDGNFKAVASTVFAFQSSDAEIIINDEQLTFLDSIASYLERFKEKKMRLIAFYGQNETNNTVYENLGIARAETVKNILVRRGAPETSIDVEGKKFERLVLNENGMISGGVEFDIFDKDISNTITEAPFLKEKIFYFKKNKYMLSSNEKLEIFAAGLKQYMVDEQNAEVVIFGSRETEEHQSIDLLRAKFIEDVFLKHGIDVEKISLDIKAPDPKKKDEEVNNKKVEIKVL